MGIILQPFAWLLLFFYNLFNSYGLALILFAVIIKLILFPVTLKSKKSMIQTTMLSEQMQKLQKQYGKDRERYNLEIQKLYEKEHVNPMGGCLWSLIPMAVLLLLYGIIRYPLTYFMGMSDDQIQALATQLNWSDVAVSSGWVTAAVMEKAENLFQNGTYNQLYLLSLVNADNLEALKSATGASDLFVLNFQFLGINLSRIPDWKFWKDGLDSLGLFILPLVSTAVSFLSMKVSMATNQMNKKERNPQMDSTNKALMWTMPVMSLWIGFTVPAGLTVYWIAQYFITMIQEVICGKMLKKDYEAAREAAAKREEEEREEEKRRKEEARLERQRRLEEEKKNRGKKKPPQKKREDEPEQEGVNKADSREGIRAYARGRSYIPGRYGGVTPYTDPNELFRATAQAAKKGGKKEKPAPASQEEEQQAPKPQAIETSETPDTPVQPGEEQSAPLQTEEVEIEVEEIEIEVDEDEDKEG